MAFNRNILYVPTKTDRVVRFDITTPSSPVALADLVLGLDVEVGSLALFSNGDVVLLDTKNGRLIKIDPTGSVLWNVLAPASTEIPRGVMVDKAEDVWVGFNGGKVAVFFGSTGTLDTRIDDTNNAVLQGSTFASVLAYDDVVGRIVLIDIGSRTISQDFQISELVQGCEPTPLKQIGMFGPKYFIPVKRLSDNKYLILEFSDGALLQILSFDWPKRLTGTLTDASGNILAMDEFGRIIRFLSTTALDAIYSLESKGRMQGLAFDHTGGTIFGVTDALFADKARAHSLDPTTGVATFLEYNTGAFEGGDMTGYQFGNVMSSPAIALAPPVVTLSLIESVIFTSETVITGSVGAAINATQVQSVEGNAPVEADGSFALRFAGGTPGSFTLTFVGPGGNTVQIVTLVSFTGTAATAKFIGTKFSLNGGWIRMFLTQSGGDPLTTGTHRIRIKQDSGPNAGKYWNKTNLVASNGLWIKLAHEEQGVWMFEFIPPEVGDYTVYFEECGVGTLHENHAIIVTDEEQTLDEVLTEVKKLENPFQLPSTLLTDPNQVGGFIADQFRRIRFFLNVLGFKANLVFPRTAEGIAVNVSTLFLKTGDTPRIAITVIDSVTGKPKDITGNVLKFRARTQPGGTLIFERTLTHVDSENGQTDVVLTASDTSTSGRFVAEVEETDPTGVVLTTATFNLDINPDLT